MADQQQQPQGPQFPFGSAEWFTAIVGQVAGQVAQQIMQNMPQPQIIVHTPEVAHPAPAPATHQKLFADPRRFDGKKENARAFIREQEARYNAASTPPMNDPGRIYAFASWFSPGPATQWHQSLYNTNPDALTDWRTFIDAFRTQFVDPNEATRYRNKLEKLRQEYGQSVNEYASKFKDWAALAEIDERTKVLWYFRGLQPAVQKALNVGSGVPSDFNTLDLYAQRIDSFSDAIREVRQGNSQSSGSGNRSQNNQNRSSNSSNYNSNNSASTPAGTSTSGPAPMEIDAVRANLVNGRLSQQERDRRRRDGDCMYCGKSGHIVSNCPTRASKAAPGKAQPRD